MTVVRPGNEPDVIDTHVHVWDPHRFTLPWLNGLPNLCQPQTWSRYWKETNATAAMFVECDVTPSAAAGELRWVSRYARRDKRIVGIVAGCNLAQRDFAKQWHHSPDVLVKGLRQVLLPGASGGELRDLTIERSLASLAETGLSFDLCIDASRLRWARRLAGRLPELRIILDHCGLPPMDRSGLRSWRRDLLALGERGNVACKVSGLRTHLIKGSGRQIRVDAVLNTVHRAFGSDRLLYGSDWPLCNLNGSAHSWHLVVRRFSEAHAIPEMKLFSQNAAIWYRIGKRNHK